ncbi:phage tail protein [Desulfobaculum bizertense]|uniref:phage tail protein n=1 Tax=Desulfobaculum bizertense TaxID=376490 RepID=UPI001F414419|nr:phage tail protein [Desulfobaculum bizertense]UIJ36890.1 phage tail protein [Desulfobaculum bizertense]
MNIQLRGIGPDIDRVRKALEGIPQGINRISSTTANKVARGSLTEASRLIRQEIELKSRDVKKEFIIRKATWSNPVAVLTASGRRAAALDHYPARPKSAAQKRPPKGISVKIKKRQPYKIVHGAFWGTARNGRRMLFKRVQKDKRLPIKRLYGPSMMTYYRRKSFQRRLIRRTDERLQKVFIQELNNLLRKRGSHAR